MSERFQSLTFTALFYLLVFSGCFFLAYNAHLKEDAIREPLLQRIQQLELELERCHCEP